MEKTKKMYEVCFIVNATLEDPQIDSVIDKVKDLIIKQHGEIIEVIKWGRKRFAYPIKKKNNGFYVIIEFNGIGVIIPRLERHFTLEENILRFLILKIDKRDIKGRIAAGDVLKQSTVISGPAGSTAILESDVDEDLDTPFSLQSEE